MHIKELIIDGFKSYANRTVISGWDKEFNAITGLNGSGKSNILDSICFVLGITNLSNVRATNLTELVYKSGQSRVTKASVTIVFDNHDKANSPVGFEACDEITVTRQVVVGGRNKYLINGVTAQTNRVQNLFHSVQLNVNNPHFLIMQGRITKVLNMKPPETLGMIEEAAGTRMYEMKKLAAQKTIEKKQSKVEEINKLLADEITPTLEKLRKERTAYQQWVQNNTEIERLARFCVAHEFFQLEQAVLSSAESGTAAQQQVDELKERCETLTAGMKARDQESAELAAEKERHLSAEFKSLEAKVALLAKELVKETSASQHLLDACSAEEKAIVALGTQETECQAAIVAAEQSVLKLQAESDKCEAAHNALLEQISSLQGQQIGISMNNDDKNKNGGKGSLSAQLMEAQRLVSAAEAEAKQAETRAAHARTSLKTKQKQATSSEAEYNKLSKEIEDAKVKEAKLLADQAKTGFDSNEFKRVENEYIAAEEARQNAKDALESAQASIGSQFDFNYSAPSKGFDHSKVKGLVAKLITLKDAKAAVALEVAAGGRLYNVVVDTEATGKELLANGKLQRRVTLIPLNQIAKQSLSATVVERAKELVGENNVNLALDLVGCDDEVESAIRFVFGQTLICKDAAAAKRVTFDRSINARSVTLDGDSFDPAGTLTGGSDARGGSVLVKLDAAARAAQKLAVSEKLAAELKAQLDKMTAAEHGSRDRTEKIELLQHEINLSQNRLSASAFARIQAECDALQTELESLAAAATAAVQKRAAAELQCAALEKSLKETEMTAGQQAKEIEKTLAALKKSSVATGKAAQTAAAALSQRKLELESLRTELRSLGEQRVTLTASRSDASTRSQAARAAVAAKKAQHDAAAAELDAERAKIQATDERMQALKKRRDQLSRQAAECALEMKKCEAKIARSQQETKEKKAKCTAYADKYEWIASERSSFGKAHTDYDFDAVDPKKASSTLAKLQEEQAGLSKKINKKVMGMFEKAEQEFKELVKKRDIIEKDRRTIEAVISELDHKKNEALKTTWQKVNKDFGSIFSTLLPGTTARLEPTFEGDTLEGLEVKVAFGDVWKESLTELSGGQRSLLALSLILALLLFKPAPMYILDEIDAALDLSHTQNIGQMIKNHFSQSQFIVVSLKEGMFSNANVVFRTKFVEGVSTVSRTLVQRPEADKENASGNARPAARGKAALKSE